MLLIGIVLIRWNRPLAIGFCRIGKAIWRVGTFGLTDMGWIYDENTAPKAFKLLGIVSVLQGMILIIIAWVSRG